MSTLWHVHFTGGEKVAWALDEDLRVAREAMEGHVVPTSPAAARIIHSAYWPRLLDFGERAVRGKKLICFADNPPVYSLTQPEFSQAAARVDLWIARTREAESQFRMLGLPVARAPYTVDATIFRPLENDGGLRRELGIDKNAFVIGNFHRDTEGTDLRRLKRQKGADILFEIAKELYQRLPNLVVLLAGPRRHWLRRRLTAAGIPFRFHGRIGPNDQDDYDHNILPRRELNRLYQALDVTVVPSRWEGGPHSLLEALFAGQAVISTPVGIARDILPSEMMFRTVDEAVRILENHARTGSLREPAFLASRRADRENSTSALSEALVAIYQELPRGPERTMARLSSAVASSIFRVRRQLGQRRVVFPPNAQSAMTDRIIAKVQNRHGTASPSAETPLAVHDPAKDEQILLGAALFCQGR